MNSFVFSMGELWGRNADVRLFDEHARAVTRFVQEQLRKAVLPPAAAANSNPIGVPDIRPQNGLTEKLLTFELPGGCRILTWPDRPLPEVICSLEVRENVGLLMLWHSRLEQNFDTDPPRETVISPLVTGMSYDYYDPNTTEWTNQATLKLDDQGNPVVPQRLRLTFTYKKLTRETIVIVPTPGQGLPVF